MKARGVCLRAFESTAAGLAAAGCNKTANAPEKWRAKRRALQRGTKRRVMGVW